ncbi:MAG: hypothetical protein HRU14_00215 [Planctomycetes bacterium]|nr:hypothetical protein [Planctomycetota bacterium]
MDVFNVGRGDAPKAPEGGPVDSKKSASHRGESASKTEPGAASDSYAGSESARQVRTLVDRLIAGPDSEVRADLVDQFRALLQVAAFDTPENAARAADALLSGDA